MATTIHFQGGSVDVVESYNLVRQRIDRAIRDKIAAESGDAVTDTKGKTVDYAPSKMLSFTIADDEGEPDGRFTFNLEKYICTTSDIMNDKE